jgi:hypothetical protein
MYRLRSDAYGPVCPSACTQPQQPQIIIVHQVIPVYTQTPPAGPSIADRFWDLAKAGINAYCDAKAKADAARERKCSIKHRKRHLMLKRSRLRQTS